MSSPSLRSDPPVLDPGLLDSVAHLHPLQRQHAIELARRRQQNLSAVPASFRARSRFLNLRDSVRKSPTKSTAKVVGGRKDVPWIPFSKVLNGPNRALNCSEVQRCCGSRAAGSMASMFPAKFSAGRFSIQLRVSL